MKFAILGNTKLNGYNHGIYSWFVKTYYDGLNHNNFNPILIDFKSNSLSEIKFKLIDNSVDYVFTHLTFHSNVHKPEDTMQMYKDVSRMNGTKFIHTCNDARETDRYMNDISDVFYCGFVGTKPMLENCPKAWKIPVFYAPYSSMTYKKMAKKDNNLAYQELVFTGGRNTHEDRKKFLDLICKEGLPLRCFQTQSGNDIRHLTPELSVSSKCILGLSTLYHIPFYQEVRWVQYGGCGANLIMRKGNGMDIFLPEKYYYPFYSYDADGIELIKKHYNDIFKDENVKRKEIFDFIQKYHSSKVRIKEIIDCLNGKINLNIDYYKKQSEEF